MSEYVKEAIEKKEIDVLDGLKIIIRLFPKNIILDDFMFCVLSICIFISSLMDKLQTDIDTQIKEAATTKANTMVGAKFLKFCGKYELVKLAEQAARYADFLQARYPQT